MGKQVFKNVNKKEFKFMLPKYLRKFDVKTVRNWCLDEMDIMSKKRLRAIILRQFLASSSSESEDEVKNGKESKDDDLDAGDKSKKNKKLVKKKKEKSKKSKKKKVKTEEKNIK